MYHIGFKLHVEIRHRNTQVKFKFGHGPMIFARVIIQKEIFTLCSLTFVVLKCHVQLSLTVHTVYMELFVNVLKIVNLLLQYVELFVTIINLLLLYVELFVTIIDVGAAV
jgi:hypothetical protein